jgi:phosphatidylinositol kinase/protein kinase (PI-3  family)
VRAVYSRETLSKWLRTQNPTEAAWRKAVETFMASCAGYTVLTFALGLADRHNDNIMLTKDGNLFRILFKFMNYRCTSGSNLFLALRYFSLILYLDIDFGHFLRPL